MNGTVSWFNNVKGWGKILADDGSELFVHHRDITDDKFYPVGKIEKFRTLTKGQRVIFEMQETDKIMNAAVNVQLLDLENSSD